MAQPTRTISPIQGELIRIMRLDECGVPVSGAGGLVVSEGFVQVTPSPQYEDGTDYQRRNAKGGLCVNRTGPDQFRRIDLSIEFCAIDPDVVELITGAELITTGAPATGTGFWVTEGAVETRWSLEVWQNAGDEECVGGLEQYAYWAFPHLGSGRFNDFTINDGVLEWSLSARTYKASPSWYSPGEDWISSIPVDAHFGFNIASLPLPATTGDGAAPLPGS